MDRTSTMYAEQTVEVINQQLETYLEELERLSLFPYFHSGVMDILRKTKQQETPEERYNEHKLFMDMFDNIMLNPREDLLNVTLYRQDGNRYFNTRVYVNLNHDYDWKSSDWYQRTLAANGNVVYTIHSSDDKRFSTLDHDIFYISRLIKSDNGKNLGVILIDANFQGIAEMLKAVGLGKNSNVIVRDGSGTIIFSQNKLYLKEVMSSHFEEKKLNIEGETLFIENYESSKTGWTISVIVPSGEISNSFVSIREIISMMLVLFALITILVTFWFSEKLTRPVRELHQRMKMVENGNYDVTVTISSNDEIGSLGRTFNKMSSKIKELIHEVYEFTIRQKEAELTNLKMQIRPHFLYNTLEAIRSLADIQDNQEVVKMTTSLGSILRYSIKTHAKLVPIEKELDYIRQYLTIQQIMVGDSIKIEYDIDPDIVNYQSIPLMFQPLVENAFQHGLYGKRRGGLIRIEGKRAGDKLHFTILDNGKGITAEKLELINKALKSPKKLAKGESPIGIGVSNVNQRINIVFGESYGLQMAQNPEGGTSVHITIPIVDCDQQTK